MIIRENIGQFSNEIQDNFALFGQIIGQFQDFTKGNLNKMILNTYELILGSSLVIKSFFLYGPYTVLLDTCTLENCKVPNHSWSVDWWCL